MKKNLFFSFALIGEIGISTALPLVAFALIGRKLDQYFATHPWGLLVAIGLATILIFFIIKKIVSRSINQLNQQ